MSTFLCFILSFFYHPFPFSPFLLPFHSFLCSIPPITPLSSPPSLTPTSVSFSFISSHFSFSPRFPAFPLAFLSILSYPHTRYKLNYCVKLNNIHFSIISLSKPHYNTILGQEVTTFRSEPKLIVNRKLNKRFSCFWLSLMLTQCVLMSTSIPFKPLINYSIFSY